MIETFNFPRPRQYERLRKRSLFGRVIRAPRLWLSHYRILRLYSNAGRIICAIDAGRMTLTIFHASS